MAKPCGAESAGLQQGSTASLCSDYGAFIAASENSTTIINNVSASANTGNNTASEGEVVEGEARASVKVKTIIDGQVVEDIDIEETKEGGDASVKVESRVEADDEKAKVETTTVINGEEKTSSREINLENGTTTDNELIAAENNEPDTSGSLESPETDNIVLKIWTSIFNSLKAGILKILNIFT